MDNYIFENGSKPIKPDFVDLNYTFENMTKPEATKANENPAEGEETSSEKNEKS